MEPISFISLFITFILGSTAIILVLMLDKANKFINYQHSQALTLKRQVTSLIEALEELHYAKELDDYDLFSLQDKMNTVAGQKDFRDKGFGFIVNEHNENWAQQVLEEIRENKSRRNALK